MLVLLCKPQYACTPVLHVTCLTPGCPRPASLLAAIHMPTCYGTRKVKIGDLM
jgi:hypothetical protein